jgi:hypothetical protein
MCYTKTGVVMDVNNPTSITLMPCTDMKLTYLDALTPVYYCHTPEKSAGDAYFANWDNAYLDCCRLVSRSGLPCFFKHHYTPYTHQVKPIIFWTPTTRIPGVCMAQPLTLSASQHREVLEEFIKDYIRNSSQARARLEHNKHMSLPVRLAFPELFQRETIKTRIAMLIGGVTPEPSEIKNQRRHLSPNARRERQRRRHQAKAQAQT